MIEVFLLVDHDFVENVSYNNERDRRIWKKKKKRGRWLDACTSVSGNYKTGERSVWDGIDFVFVSHRDLMVCGCESLDGLWSKWLAVKSKGTLDLCPNMAV